MYSVFDILESKNQFIKDGILYINDKAAGIISPTLVEGFVNNIPKKGRVKLEVRHKPPN